MAYTYDPLFAADPNNPNMVAKNAAVLIFDPAAPGVAVTITDATGSPIPNPITVNAAGFGPAFQHPTLDRLGWSGGGFENYITSYEGMKQVATDAKTAAQTAAADAGTAAVADVAARVAAGEFTGAAGKDGATVLPTDTAIKDAINNTGSATRGALDVTIVAKIGADVPPIVNTAVERARLKNDFGFIGDSITIGGDSPGRIGLSWPAYASVMSGQRIHYVVNAAVAGQTTNSMVPRLQADIIDKGVGTCFILAGTNDIQTGMTMAQWQTNITTMIDMLYAAGITPVLGTIPPNATNSTFKPLIVKYNAWLRRFTESRGITLVDFYGALVDPTNGNWLPGLNGVNGTDPVHPGDAGYRVMAQLVIDTLVPLLPANRPPLAQDNLDTNNLAVNGLAITDTNADGLADNWKGTPTTAGAVVSLATVTGVPGKVQRLTCTATSAIAGMGYTRNGGVATGDKIAIAGRISKTDGLKIDLTVIIYGGSPQTYRPLQNVTGAITNGIFYQELIVQTGGNVVDLSVVAQPGTGTVDLGQLTIYNLTALGIA